MESYLEYERPYGVAPLMDEVLMRARTSASRLSTYCSGKVTPSAALLLRILDQAPDGRSVARLSPSRTGPSSS